MFVKKHMFVICLLDKASFDADPMASAPLDSYMWLYILLISINNFHLSHPNALHQLLLAPKALSPFADVHVFSTIMYTAIVEILRQFCYH